MPVLLSGNSNMAIIPMEYSTKTVARSFVVLNEFTASKVPYQIIFNASAPCAAVIELIPTERKGGRLVHKVVATLWLEKTTKVGCVKVENVWEDPTVMQVEGVVTAEPQQGFGLATRMYESVVTKAGVTLLSDREQYAGGKNLWQKIARSSDVLDVFILDMETACFHRFDGSRVRYDGTNIPESEVWSTPPDTEMERIVLVAEAKGKR